MTDRETLNKLFEAALREPEPTPERKPRNVLPSKSAATAHGHNGNTGQARPFNGSGSANTSNPADLQDFKINPHSTSGERS